MIESLKRHCQTPNFFLNLQWSMTKDGFCLTGGELNGLVKRLCSEGVIEVVDCGWPMKRIVVK